jgi:hypothetical protein
MAAQVADLRATTPEEMLELYWMVRASESPEAFRTEFPTPEALEEAMNIARSLDDMEAELAWLLMGALDNFKEGDKSC